MRFETRYCCVEGRERNGDEGNGGDGIRLGVEGDKAE